MKWKVIIIILLILVIVVLIGIKYREVNLIGLPQGELKYSISSPNNEIKCNYYFIDGGLISADAMRIEIETSNEKYNLYYCYKECDFDATITWKDNENILLGNRIININEKKIKE